MNNNKFISNALKFISQSFDEEMSLEKVAENAGFSVSYFNRIFAESTGKTVMEYVREYRLIKAAEALRTSDKSVLDISLDSGYSNPENFSRAFKARYGSSPSEYREAKKNESLLWKDYSTGACISRFEKQFPQYKRIDKDEFIDWLYINGPVKNAFNICFYPQIDCAAFKLSEDEYICIEEYRAEEMTMTLYCKESNTEKYIEPVKAFKNSTVTVMCDADTVFTGFDGAEERFDYAYLKRGVDYSLPAEHLFREIEETDAKALKKFSSANNNQVWHVFEQNKKYGNFAGTLFFGLWHNEKLIACAMPGIEEGRGLKICDIGGIFFADKEKTKELNIDFWKAIIDYCLKNDLLPVNGGVTAEDELLGCSMSEAAGYTRVAKKYVYKL